MRFWLSWYDTRYGQWELHSPWWVSGERCDDGAKTICAAVEADSEEDAKRKVLEAHDEYPDDVEWRFCEEKPDDWSPFCDRFNRAKWMQWPTAPKPKENDNG